MPSFFRRKSRSSQQSAEEARPPNLPGSDEPPRNSMGLNGLIEQYGSTDQHPNGIHRSNQGSPNTEEGYHLVQAQEAASNENAAPATQRDTMSNPTQRRKFDHKPTLSQSSGRAPIVADYVPTNDTILAGGSSANYPHNTTDTMTAPSARSQPPSSVNFSRPVTPKKPGRQASADSGAPQFHRPSPSKKGSTNPQAIITSVSSSSLYQKPSGPSLFLAPSSTSLTDFRISPTFSKQPTTSPQAQVRQIEQARKQTLKRARAAKRLNLMLIGQRHTGRTSFLKALLTTLGVEGSKIEVNRTTKMQRLVDVEVAPSREILLKGMASQSGGTESGDGDSDLDNESTPALRQRKRKTRQLSMVSTSTYFSSLGPKAPPQKLLLSILDTPSLPASMVNCDGPEPPVALLPLVSQLTARYDASLAEERKLSRVPLQSAQVQGRHINAVIWMIEPREILEGEWYWELEKQKTLDEKWHEVEQRRRWTQDSKSMMSASEADPVEASPKLDRAPSKDSSKSGKNKEKRRRSRSLHHRPKSNTGKSGDRTPRTSDGEENQENQAKSIDGPISAIRRSMSYGARGSGSSAGTLKAAAEAMRNVPNGSTADSTHVPRGGAYNNESVADDGEYVPNLSPTSRAVLRHLLPLVPVIPVIARSDTLTLIELRTVRQGIERGWNQVVSQLRREKGLEDGRGEFGWDWMGSSSASKQKKGRDGSAGSRAEDEGVLLGEEGINKGGGTTASPDKQGRSLGLRGGSGSDGDGLNDDENEDLNAGSDEGTDTPRRLLRVADVVPSDSTLRTTWPLAIFSSEFGPIFTSPKPRSSSLELSRTYPSYQLSLLNPSHCDFLLLKCLLLGTHTGRILKASEERFEEWRRRVLGG